MGLCVVGVYDVRVILVYHMQVGYIEGRSSHIIRRSGLRLEVGLTLGYMRHIHVQLVQGKELCQKVNAPHASGISQRLRYSVIYMSVEKHPETA